MQRFGALPSINGSYFMPSDAFLPNVPILGNTNNNTAPSKPVSTKVSRGKKRLDARRHSCGYGPVSTRETHQLPAQVARRNERERNRVKQVNLGFATLREHVRLPNGSKNKKMSKVETLKGALDYIRRLQNMLGEMDPQSRTADHAPSQEPASSSASTSERSPDDAAFSSQLASHQHTFASMDMLDSLFDSDSDSPDSSMNCDFLKTEDEYPWI